MYLFLPAIAVHVFPEGLSDALDATGHEFTRRIIEDLIDGELISELDADDFSDTLTQAYLDAVSHMLQQGYEGEVEYIVAAWLAGVLEYGILVETD